ncbi:hypothetical protein [Streptomyces filamentosus]|uniref:hypothetical protein n=1 Tax=Streptomyces filamentosus TaxID=67294 RepID=UPI0037D47761
MSTMRRPLGTGPDVEIPERDARARSAFERAVEGDWVEVPEPPAARPTGGRRPLGPRGS